MIENPECYQVGEFKVPDDLLVLLNSTDKIDHPDILRPMLSSTSRVIYFPVKMTTRYDIPVQDDLLLIRSLAISIAEENIRRIFPNYVIIKGEISLLKKLGKQSAHQDPRVFQRFARRIHMPVITNNHSHLCIDDRRYHMAAGSIWVFDNVTGMHFSQNFGLSNRWHIIVDIIEQDKLKFILEKITVDEFYSLWWDWKNNASAELINQLNLTKEVNIPSHKSNLYD